MNGGNISDGPSDISGCGIELLEKRKAPEEVGGGKDAKIARLVATADYLEKQVRRQKDENNLLSDKLRALAAEGQRKIDSLRWMFSKTTDELVEARLKLDKYITKCDELKDMLDSYES